MKYGLITWPVKDQGEYGEGRRENLRAFENLVTTALLEGYQLHGPTFIFNEEYHQAVIKFEE